jgi:hypothetical protein
MHLHPIRHGVALASVSCLMALAGAPARAADGTLHVHASPQVINAGQSASIDVLASFPSSMYAFASARFSVFSTDPAWQSVSAGAIVGPDVLGIAASQPHMPQQGVFANPANPYRVWHGVLAPAVRGPALVEVKAAPREFSVYPSALTSSSIPCESTGGSDLILVEPLSVGRWLAAPRAGTHATVSDDVVVDGRIITGENYDSIGIGLLLPAIRPARTSGFIVEFDRPPQTFSFGVQIDSDTVPSDTFSLNWAKIEYSREINGVIVAAGAGGGPHVKFNAYRELTSVANGELGRGEPDERAWPLFLPSVPPRHRVSLEQSPNGGANTRVRLEYDEPVRAMVRGRDGRVRTVVIDSVEVVAPVAQPARQSTSNNLHQLGLAVHTFDATGVERIRVAPESSR